MPGLHWYRMPLPIDLNHINLWLIEDGAGFTLIDTGFPAISCTAAWEELEATLLRDRLATPQSACALMPTLFGRRLMEFQHFLGLHECVAGKRYARRRLPVNTCTGWHNAARVSAVLNVVR